jgi:hypothetical protein
MSIEPILQEQVNSGALFELASLFTGDETARTMIVSADILAVVTPPFADNDEGVLLGEFRAWLDCFLEGAEISVAENPDQKPRDTMLARVHPVDDEFWAIRVTDPEDSPGLRSFGAFAAKNKFVALTWEKRDVIGDEFDEEVDAVRESWQDRFGEEQPHFGDNLDAYLSTYRAV